MKILMSLILGLFVVSQAVAGTLSDKEIIRSYDACMKFLMLSPAKQAEVAHRAHKPLNLVMWACRLQKREGLKEVLRLNHEYNDWWRHRNDGGGSGDSSPSAPSCVSTVQCVGDQQCIGIGGSGTCQSIPGGCDNGPNSCIAGETCSNGVCK